MSFIGIITINKRIRNMDTTYEVITKFRRGDKVRIKYDLTFFDPSVHSIVQTVLEVRRDDVDGMEQVSYRTTHPDPILGGYYNESELVGWEPPLLQKDAI